jgi:hypothetical protein
MLMNDTDHPLCNSRQLIRPPLALSVPLSRFTSRVGGGSAFVVRHHLDAPVIVLISLLVVGCGHSDAKIQQGLAGTWDIDKGFGVHGTVVTDLDGNYKSQFTGYKDGHISIVEGTLLVKDGVLVDTVTKDNATNAVPRIYRGQIVRIDKDEFVMREEQDAYDTVAKRVDK